MSFEKYIKIDSIKWLIPLLAILLYTNTLTHQYTQDDAIVIYDNEYTTQGLAGIPNLLKYDTFRGFFKEEGKAKVVSGGRYRPLTPVMFAVEYQVFGKQSFVGHLINVLLYAFLGFLIFHLLARLLTGVYTESAASWIAFGAALLYVAHPIHTEAVANIKGRDEIMAMLCSMGAVWYGLRYIDARKIKHLALTFVVFFLGMMSKENTITFLAVFPLTILLFRRSVWSSSVRPWLAMLAGAVVFIGIRTTVLGLDFGGTPMELMNNPFLKWTGTQYVPMEWSEKAATIIYTLGRYVWLLVFPHPLTHDYYPRYIEMMSFSDWQVLVSVVVYVMMLLGAFWALRKSKAIAFSILYFLVTLSIVSNVVFPIGTNMSERFLFMSSLGYTLLVSIFLFSVVRAKTSRPIMIGVLVLVLGLYSVKTVSRNTVWKDDFTLFTTDVKTSTNSAKVLNAAGGTLTDKAESMTDGPEKTKILKQAVGYLDQALAVHPRYKNAAFLKGNAHFYLQEYDAAIQAYEKALRLSPSDISAKKNLAVALREAGKYAGEREGNLTKAINMLRRSYATDAEDMETVRLLGVAHGVQGQHEKAIEYFEQVAQKAPSKSIYESLAVAYQNLGDAENAERYRAKAAQTQ